MNLSSVKHVHLTAICGTAMGALAGMLIKKGYKVTGSDEGIYPPMSDHLKNMGIDIMPGFKPENLDVNPDLVIIGNTVKKINPEAQEVVRRGIPYMHLPKAMGEFFIKDKHSVVIGGTHGKTTTTALCSWVLESAGLDPGFMVGGILKNYDTNSKVGGGPYFVIEGDEYDSAYFDKVPKFWHYMPKTAAITSVEFDHADIYRDIDHVKEAFTHFASIIPKDGFLAACADFPHVFDCVGDASCKILTYGFSDKSELKIRDLVLDESGSAFTLSINGDDCRFRLPMWGSHNASNATAVIAIATNLGLTPSQIQKGFDTFKGIKRRQEIIMNENDIIVIDDFAHHPTKVRETVKAVRNRYPDRRLISVYEPRTNTSRRNFFQNNYPASFDGSDITVISSVYNKEQIESEKVMDAMRLTEDIKNRGIDSKYISETDEIVDYISDIASPGDVILIMSNGGFGGIYKKLPEKLKSCILK